MCFLRWLAVFAWFVLAGDGAYAQTSGLVLITEAPAPSPTLSVSRRTVFHGRALEPSAATTIGLGRFSVTTSANTWAGPQAQAPGGHVEGQWRFSPARRLDLTVGGGIRRERDGDEFLLARATAATRLGRSTVVGHVTLERGRQAGRDALDLVTAAGWTRPLTRSLHVGAEAIGEDLEGLWDPHEADGGARLFAGPTIAFGRADRRASGRLTAGADLRGSRICTTPSTAGMRAGLALRATVTVGF